MTESVYFSTARLTRSKVFSKMIVSESTKPTKTPKLNLSKLSKRKHVDIKIESESKQPDHDMVSVVKREKWEPPSWRPQLENIYEMRKNRDAPVDTMGCDVISDVQAAPEVCIKYTHLHVELEVWSLYHFNSLK